MLAQGTTRSPDAALITRPCGSALNERALHEPHRLAKPSRVPMKSAMAADMATWSCLDIAIGTAHIARRINRSGTWVNSGSVLVPNSHLVRDKHIFTAPHG